VGTLFYAAILAEAAHRFEATEIRNTDRSRSAATRNASALAEPAVLSPHKQARLP
jgi:hypothetical protein